MEYQIQVPLGSLPVALVLVGNQWQGRVAFVKVAPFITVFDCGKEGSNISAAFYQDEFHIFGSVDGEEVFEYDTIYDYKELPVMLEWLKQQNLQEPTNVVFG